MIFRRGRGGPDRWLRPKVVLFFLAAGLFAVGASSNDDRFVIAAIVVAAVAFLLRFVPQRDGDGEDEDTSADG